MKKDYTPSGGIMTGEEQLERWAAGESVHNGAERIDGECCPDFSCCRPERKWPEARRVFFLEHPKARSEMLFGALAGMVQHEGKEGDVYLTG